MCVVVSVSVCGCWGWYVHTVHTTTTLTTPPSPSLHTHTHNNKPHTGDQIPVLGQEDGRGFHRRGRLAQGHIRLLCRGGRRGLLLQPPEGGSGEFREGGWVTGGGSWLAVMYVMYARVVSPIPSFQITSPTLTLTYSPLISSHTSHTSNRWGRRS